jgi:hypothetical protein
MHEERSEAARWERDRAPEPRPVMTMARVVIAALVIVAL